MVDIPKKSRGICEFKEGKDYFVGTLKQIAKWTQNRFNPQISEWVIIAKEDFDTIIEENEVLWDELDELDEK